MGNWQIQTIDEMMNYLGTCLLTFVLLEYKYPLCGSDGGDDPLHELCGLLPGESRLEEEDWRKQKSIDLPVRRADLVVI